MSRADRIEFIGERQSDVHLLVADAGVKAVNLARLDRLGMPVPPALVLGTALSQEYLARGSLPPGFRIQLAAALRELEDATGRQVGGRRPLLLAVRSSPVVTMPGMLDTVLNVGLTEERVHDLIRLTGNAWMAWDCYRRLVRAFAETVARIPMVAFDEVERAHLVRAGEATVQRLDPAAMRELARASADLLRASGQANLSDDPIDQLVRAVEAVFASWDTARAREYRRICGIGSRAGIGVLIQAMVFGNAGARSGSGVAFTRDPATGEDELFVDFLLNAQGQDLGSGREAVGDGDLLEDAMPEVWAELQGARPSLEREFGDMQGFEFTVQDGEIFFLQTRSGQRTPWAAARIAVDLVRTGVVETSTALDRLAPYDLASIIRRSVAPSSGIRPIGNATGASPGVATGEVAFDVERARRRAASHSVILVRPRISTDDLPGIAVSEGVLAGSGGRTSHAAVVARQLGKPCIVGCTSLRIDEEGRACTLGAWVLREGDLVTIDGTTGLIYAGGVAVSDERPDEIIAVIESWRRQPPGAIAAEPTLN